MRDREPGDPALVPLTGKSKMRLVGLPAIVGNVRRLTPVGPRVLP
jgi:hypothetical protein